MHRDVVGIRQFYDGTRLGMHARGALRRALRALWPDVRGQVVVGYGFPPPVLGQFRNDAVRVLALMPAEQGACKWPAGGPNATALVPAESLPLPTGLADRLVVLHGYELAHRPAELLAELHRVLAPTGRIAFLVPNRTGLWARRDTTPFGSGQPFTPGQLRRALRDAGFAPCAESAALYVPPTQRRFWLRSARMIETIGSRAHANRLAGVLIVEATKLVALPPGGTVVSRVREMVGALEGIATPAAEPAAGRG